MKKLLVILVLALSLGACGQEEKDQTPAAFMAGYGNTFITPLYSQGVQALGGHSGAYSPTDLTPYEDILSELPCSCIALTDSTGKTVLVYSLETLKCYGTILNLTYKISAELGVPRENILIAATHAHHAPNTQSSYANAEYVDYVGVQMVLAGRLAMEDRKPVQMYATEAELEGYNACRHYVMSDGSKVTTTEYKSAVHNGLTAVGHVVEADQQMQLVKFVREDGKDIVLMNWQSHPYTNTNDKNVVSCTELMRKVFEKNDQLLIHFNGACGNGGYASNVVGATKYTSEQYQQCYTALAEEALKLDSTYRQKQTDNLTVMKKNVLALNKTVTVYGLGFGDTAIAFAPYEMFMENGQYIKENSPFETTIVATNAMGNYGYIPSEATFDYGGYEVKSRYSGIGRGSAEALQEGFVALLKQIKG